MDEIILRLTLQAMPELPSMRSGAHAVELGKEIALLFNTIAQQIKPFGWTEPAESNNN